ncbi:SCO2322 family protein [Streptomyces sp. NPDC018031]|uniref:SCO2322 family protein n=1 Tax=Streptomyces sp. NPDC018031 TaxID=3365033 RepID=UPI0037B93186
MDTAATPRRRTGPGTDGTARPPAPPRARPSAVPGTAISGAVAALAAGALIALGATPAAAADGYRYWSYWERDGGRWTYATQGPGTARPGDGDTVGFRYAVSPDSRNATRPRGTASFDTICGDTPAGDGGKRVAVVIDFGTAADAPDGHTPPAARTACARVAGGATAADALAAVAEPLRYDSSALLCAIGGYPRSGCAEVVSRSAGSGSADDDGGSRADGGDGGDAGPSAGLIGGAAAVVALGAAALWQARRRRG